MSQDIIPKCRSFLHPQNDHYHQNHRLILENLLLRGKFQGVDDMSSVELPREPDNRPNV